MRVRENGIKVDRALGFMQCSRAERIPMAKREKKRRVKLGWWKGEINNKKDK
jgi:hypothetical protein